jgi:hypothetical protein
MIIRKQPKKVDATEVTSFKSQHKLDDSASQAAVADNQFKNVAYYYGRYSKTFVNTDTECSSVDKIHKRNKRISIEINSPLSDGHSTDSNSPEVRQTKAPRKSVRRMDSEKLMAIKKCREDTSPFTDQRLDSFGKDSKRISDYKRDMEALFNEINRKDRS